MCRTDLFLRSIRRGSLWGHNEKCQFLIALYLQPKERRFFRTSQQDKLLKLLETQKAKG